MFRGEAISAWLRGRRAVIEDQDPGHARRFDDLVAALIGVAVFLLCCDPRILLPGQTGWLMAGDPAQHFLGWHFFRNAPLLQFPLGANPLFGDGQPSSIVFTDSLPLLALVFKPLRALLPALFQYDGAWILACFVLQAFFARRLLSRFTDSRSLALIGAALFALSPPMIWRLYGHYSLMSHWLLLAALGEYFGGRHRRARWALLLAVCALVHAYLLAMVGALWLCELAGRRRGGELERRAVAEEAVLTTGGLILLMWVVGYFVVGEGISGAGYGFFRMNLLAPLDPGANWSLLLREQGHIAGEYEGFNFLGLACWFLLAATAPRLLEGRRPALAWRRHRPLAAMCVALSLFAISNRIYFGHYKVASYHLPMLVDRAFNVFRASGRMFWPVFYLIYLFVLLLVWRLWSREVARRLTAVALCLQVVDMSGAFSFFHQRQTASIGWTTPLQSPFWLEAGKRYKRIIVVPPTNAPEGFVPLARFAAENLLSINAAYFNRFDEEALEQAADRLATSIRADHIDPAALYVFLNRGVLWRLVEARRAKEDFTGTINGVRVLAPGLGRFARARWGPEQEAQQRPARRPRGPHPRRP